MAGQRTSLPTADAKLIDAIGVDVVSKAFDKGESTVRRWRTRGVPKKYRAAFAKLVEKGRPSQNQAEASPPVESTNHIKQFLDGSDPAPSALPNDPGTPAGNQDPPTASDRSENALTGLGPDFAALSAVSVPTAEDQDPPLMPDRSEGSVAPIAQNRPVESRRAGDVQEQDGVSSPRQQRQRRRAKRQHATAADPSRPDAPHQQTGPGGRPVIERSEAPGAPSITPTAIKHERMPVRLNRQTAIFAGIALVSAISLGLAQGLRQASSVPSETEAEQPELSQPPARAILPDFTYAEVTRPKPPAVTKAALAVTNDPRKEPDAEALVAPAAGTATASQSGPPTREQRDAEEEAALQSGLFPAGAPTSSGATPAAAAPQGQDEALAALDRLRQNLPTPQDLLPPGQPSAGDQRQSFLDAQLDDTIYLKNGLQKPLSDYEIKAGTIIPAALVTGLNSDLPGEIIGQVTEHVYDTASGQHLLIPQGSKILGRYNAQVSYGQERAQLVWDRLILPNGDSVQLEAMVGTDKAGYAGLVDEVDHHFGQLVGAVILSSFISVGANLATDSGDDVADALGDAAAQQAADIGGEIVDRQLDIQPTITVRPGFKLNILVNKDMILEPYPAG